MENNICKYFLVSFIVETKFFESIFTKSRIFYFIMFSLISIFLILYIVLLLFLSFFFKWWSMYVNAVYLCPYLFYILHLAV